MKSVLIIIIGIFDLAGIASILPFMSVAADPSFIDSNQIMAQLDEVREVQLELEKEQRRLEDEILTMVAKRDTSIRKL